MEWTFSPETTQAFEGLSRRERLGLSLFWDDSVLKTILNTTLNTTLNTILNAMPESVERAPKTNAALSLGSNQGDRLAHLDFAVVSLANYPGIEFVRASSVYETRAHVINSNEPQPDFLNAALQVMTSLTPDQLLGVCLMIEQKRGRIRSPNARWQPRTLDIDILTYNDLCSNDPTLTLPHPRLAERRFVLQPLFEIAPDLEIPAPFDRSVQYLLEQCKDSTSVKQYSERLAEPGKNDTR